MQKPQNTGEVNDMIKAAVNSYVIDEAGAIDRGKLEEVVSLLKAAHNRLRDKMAEMDKIA